MDISDKLTNLKNQLLDLAIRGKLVEQRPEEGTAEELYAQIQEEKKKLIAEGKIKKEKPLAPITDKEIPFDLPESWKWVKLGDIGNWASGSTPSRNNPEYYGKGYSWLKTGDLNDGYVEYIPENITDLALKQCSLRLNPVGSILIAMYGATVGKLGILKIPATTNQACCACIPHIIYNLYLFYFLLSQKSNFINKGAGGAQPNISKEKIINSLFPLPPLAEQKRIVDKLMSFLAVIDKAEELIEKKANIDEEIRNKILDLAIRGKLVEQRPEEGTAEELYAQIQEEKNKLIAEGKIKKEKPLPEIKNEEIPFEIPQSWKWTYIGEIFNHNTGKALKTSNIEGTELEYITTSNVYWDRFELTELRTMFFKESELERCSVKKGDLLVCEGGDFGRAAIWDKDETICIQNHLHKLTSFSKDIENRFYLYLFFVYKNNNLLSSRGIGIQSLSTNLLHKLIVPLPPLAEQKRIVAKIEELLPYCDKLK